MPRKRDNGFDGFMLRSSYLSIESDSVFAKFSDHQVAEHVPGERTYPVLSEMYPDVWPIDDLHISLCRDSLIVSGRFSQRQTQE